MKKESRFQHDLIKKIEDRFPGCYVMKNDANYIQGIPDLTVLWKDKWATLECKRSLKEVQDKRYHQANQDYYVERMNKDSFSSFICPENEEEVLSELERSFKAHSRRQSRISGSK